MTADVTDPHSKQEPGLHLAFEPILQKPEPPGGCGRIIWEGQVLQSLLRSGEDQRPQVDQSILTEEFGFKQRQSTTSCSADPNRSWLLLQACPGQVCPVKVHQSPPFTRLRPSLTANRCPYEETLRGLIMEPSVAFGSEGVAVLCGNSRGFLPAFCEERGWKLEVQLSRTCSDETDWRPNGSCFGSWHGFIQRRRSTGQMVTSDKELMLRIQENPSENTNNNNEKRFHFFWQETAQFLTFFFNIKKHKKKIIGDFFKTAVKKKRLIYS